MKSSQLVRALYTDGIGTSMSKFGHAQIRDWLGTILPNCASQLDLSQANSVTCKIPFGAEPDRRSSRIPLGVALDFDINRPMRPGLVPPPPPFRLQ